MVFCYNLSSLWVWSRFKLEWREVRFCDCLCGNSIDDLNRRFDKLKGLWFEKDGFSVGLFVML